MEELLRKPVADISIDPRLLHGELIPQTPQHVQSIASCVAPLTAKLQSALRMGFNETVMRLVAVLHGACYLQSDVMAKALAENRIKVQQQQSVTKAALDILMDITVELDLICSTSITSAAASVAATDAAAPAYRYLLEVLQLLAEEVVLKDVLGQGLIVFLVKQLRRAVQHIDPGSGLPMIDPRRSLLQYATHRIAASIMIKLMQGSKPNKDVCMRHVSEVVRVMELSQDYFLKLMCGEMLIRLYFHDANAIEHTLLLRPADGNDTGRGGGGVSSSSDTTMPPTTATAHKYLWEALQTVRNTREHLSHDLDSMLQRVVAREHHLLGGGTVGKPTSLHLDAFSIDALQAIPNASSATSAHASNLAPLCNLSGPTVLHFNIAFVVFVPSTLGVAAQVTVNFTDIRSVRISKDNTITLRLSQIPEAVVDHPAMQDAIRKNNSSAGGGVSDVALHIGVTAATVQQLKASAVMDWIAGAKAAAAQPVVLRSSNTVAAADRDVEQPPVSGSAKRPRSSSAVSTAQPRRNPSSRQQSAPLAKQPSEPQEDDSIALAAAARADASVRRREAVMEELFRDVQAMVDDYQRDMNRAREELEDTQRRVIESFRQQVTEVKHSARSELAGINKGLGVLAQSWNDLRQQIAELEASRGNDELRTQMQQEERVQVTKLKAFVDATFSSLSDEMAEYVEQSAQSSLLGELIARRKGTHHRTGIDSASPNT